MGFLFYDTLVPICNTYLHFKIRADKSSDVVICVLYTVCARGRVRLYVVVDIYWHCSQVFH